MEGLQRCLAYCSLRELVPQDDSSWEEALLVGVVRGPDLVKARVVASSHASRWSGSTGMSTKLCTIWCVMLSLARSLRFCWVFPPKVCYHFCDTVFLAVIICIKSGCSSLDHLNLIGVCVSGWCLGGSSIFHYRADKRLVGSSLCSLWCRSNVSLEKSHG